MATGCSSNLLIIMNISSFISRERREKKKYAYHFLLVLIGNVGVKGPGSLHVSVKCCLRNIVVLLQEQTRFLHVTVVTLTSN